MAEHSGGGGCCPPMDLFRSEAMHLVQVIIPIESARLTVSYLGDIGLIQFKDLNAEKSPFQQTYAGQIKRCAELARKLRFFKDQMSKADVTPSAKPEAKADFNLDDLEVNLGELEAELIEINANNEKLQRGYNELVEYKLVLQKAGEFFKAAESSAAAQQRELSSHQAAEESLETPLLKDQESTADQGKQVKLGFLTGLVPKEKALAFERILFRATRGNVFLRQASVEEDVIDPNSGEKVQKNVFVVFFSGERAKSKILKICEAFGANRYSFAEDLGKQAQMITEKLGDIMEMTFGGRYVILLMALFSIYTGLIYNEFFSVPFELFSPSAYACRDAACSESTTIGLIKVRDTYPFGVDPAWHGSRSELPFLNSLKMKMSILLGVAQMNLGIILSFFNALYFGNGVNIWFQFIPQMIFLNGLFGYLSLLIIVKWCTGSQADLYHVMIYMFLSPTDDLGENQLFPNQRTVQLVLLLLSLIAVPWMLLPKPFILKAQHNRTHQGQSYTALEDADDSLQVEAGHDSHDHEEFEFSEVFVHQLIHTIEFVLGAVSNTASYLRLWALSLAHSELSTVFYEKVLLLAWGGRKPKLGPRQREDLDV